MGWFELGLKITLGMFALVINAMLSMFNIFKGHKNKSRIERENSVKKGVVSYNPSPVEAFFPSGGQTEDVVISGGASVIRAKVISAIIAAAYNNATPVIVLHESDHDLENLLSRQFDKTGRLVKINASNPVYEPFLRMSDNEISKLIIESAPKDFDIKHNARYYIEGMGAYLRAIGREPTLSMFVKCPHHELFSKTDDLVANGKISDTKAQEIKSKLMSGQTENFKLESYFYSLSEQFADILSKKNKSVDNYSVLRAVQEKKIVLIDITSNVNLLLLNMLLTHLKNIIGRGSNIIFIADEISSDDNEMFSNFIKTHSDKCKITVSSSDIYAMCGGEEKMFHRIIGNSNKKVIFGHSSGASAAKWADAIGYYDKIEESKSIMSGKSRENIFTLFPSYSNTNTVNYNIKREHIVKPEELNRMSSNEVYIFDGNTNELAHTYLT